MRERKYDSIRIRKTIIIYSLFILFGLTGCGKEESHEVLAEAEDYRYSESIRTDEITGNDAVEEEPSDSLLKEDPVDGIHLGRMYADGIGVVHDYNAAICFWNEALDRDDFSEGHDELTDMDMAYFAFLRDRQYEEDFYFPDSVRYEFAYLEEGCPALFMSEGSGTAYPFRLYEYNEDTGRVEYVASFSSQGYVSYLENERIIISTYGNHGYYMDMISELDGNEPVLLGAFLTNAAGEEVMYYAGFPVPEDLKGQHEEDILSRLPDVGEDYRVTEEEYDRQYGELVDTEAVRTIRYDSMDEVQNHRE